MSTDAAKAWIYTPDGWRYCRIQSTSFTIPTAGFRNTGQQSHEGGKEFPAGSYLIQGPRDRHASGLLAADFMHWRKEHLRTPYPPSPIIEGDA